MIFDDVREHIQRFKIPNKWMLDLMGNRIQNKIVNINDTNIKNRILNLNHKAKYFSIILERKPKSSWSNNQQY